MSSSDVAASAAPAADPSFSGVWRSVSHVGMEAFLVGRGFSASNAALGARATVVQSIRQTRRRLDVTVGETTSTYALGNARAPSEKEVEQEAADEATAAASKAEDLAGAFFEKEATWVEVDDAAADSAVPRQLISSTGEIETIRALTPEGRMIVTVKAFATEDGAELVATTTFEKTADQVEEKTEA